MPPELPDVPTTWDHSSTVDPLGLDDDLDFSGGEDDFLALDEGAAPGHVRKVLPATRDIYLRHVKTLRLKVVKQKLARSDRPEHEARDVPPTEIVEYLLANHHTYRPKTFAAYRAAILFWLSEQSSSPDVLQATLLLTTNIPKDGFKDDGFGRGTTLYSKRSMRTRTFSRASFHQLERRLKELAASHRGRRAASGQVRARVLLVWLRAGLASGLRPIEWSRAHWEDREAGMLRVYTAKHKVGENALENARVHARALPEYRAVKIDPEDREWVDEQLTNVAEHLATGEPFKLLYENTRHTLWRVSDEVFDGKMRFTLYLMRGQFSANRKRRKSVKALSAEMGCAPVQLYSCYGKKAYGHHSAGERNGQSEVSRPAPTQAGKLQP